MTQTHDDQDLQDLQQMVSDLEEGAAENEKKEDEKSEFSSENE